MENFSHINWFKYVSPCYDLIKEGEQEVEVKLNQDVEAHIVHLMAKNFNMVNIGNQAIAIKFLEAVNSSKSKDDFILIGDECLLIHSFPLKINKWPNKKYYQEMGITSYGLANHIMEKNFEIAGKVLSAVFNRKFS